MCEGNCSKRAKMGQDMLGEHVVEDWTKDAVGRVASMMCSMIAVPFDAGRFDGMDELSALSSFLYRSSSHHVDGGLRDFYSVSPEKVWRWSGSDPVAETRMDLLRRLLDSRQSEVAYGAKSSAAAPEPKPRETSAMDMGEYERGERARLRREYIEENGFPSNSVAAFMLQRPTRFRSVRNDHGEDAVELRLGGDKKFICRRSDTETRYVTGFDATDSAFYNWRDENARLVRDYGTALPLSELREIADDEHGMFERDHGYDPQSVYAYRIAHPERVSEFDDGGVSKLSVEIGRGHLICRSAEIGTKHVNGFDACAPRIRARIVEAMG